MKGRQLIRKFRSAGVTVIPAHGKGGHVGLLYRGRKTTLPCHGDDDLSPQFIKGVCKQLGLDPKSVL